MRGKSEPCRILGVDPGSRITGWGVIDKVGSDLVLVAQGSIRMSKGATLQERLGTIHAELALIIESHGPQVVAVEAPFAGLNVRSLIQLSHARGVVLLAAQLAGLEVFEYAPRSVKSAVVGYGGAEKAQVEKMVRLLVKGASLAKMGPDAADAIAVAICHAHSARLTTMR